MANYQIYLNDALVFKRFGRNPGRGKILPFAPTMRVTAGTKWSLPHRARIPDKDVLVKPSVALRRLAKGRAKDPKGAVLWEASADPRWWPMISGWLIDYCR